MYIVQGSKHICATRDHGSADTITGEQLRANIEAHKLELGTGTSLFATNYDQFHHFATSTWLKWTWQFLWEHNI
eukprot:15148042-Ditylum_brightwellii.AAC.2